MPVYAKRVQSTHKTFQSRQNIVAGQGMVTVIPVPDSVTLCNGCNENIDEGYLVYLGKRELQREQPYDYYCEQCLKSYFKKAVIV